MITEMIETNNKLVTLSIYRSIKHKKNSLFLSKNKALSLLSKFKGDDFSLLDTLYSYIHSHQFVSVQEKYLRKQKEATSVITPLVELNRLIAIKEVKTRLLASVNNKNSHIEALDEKIDSIKVCPTCGQQIKE